MKGGLVLIAAVLLCGRVWGAEPANYYSAAEGKEGDPLAGALHSIIDGHRVFSYSQARDLLKVLDRSVVVTGDVELVYTSGTRAIADFGGGSDRHGSTGDWNREHVWPRSFGIGSNGPDNSDLFNLRPSDVDTNAKRGSLFFDETSAPAQTYPGADGVTFDTNSWEPRDDEKGNLARGCFYMSVRYDGSDAGTMDLNLGDVPNSGAGRFGKLLTLLRWHREDPVDAAERARNDRIFSNHQRNRNPFIDREVFAELVFLQSQQSVDGDEDGMGDFWEAKWLGDLDAVPGDDPDGDGATVGLEYAMLADPRSDDGNAVPQIRLLADGSVEYSFRRNRKAAGLSTVVEFSPTLAGGRWSPAVGSSRVVPVNSDLENVVVTVAGRAGFLRLRVLVP
ncbi:MAG: endonuclease [Verrucomicrobiales bacterium]|nr:endonuclease [Verrucomicrobiales bacterium]